MYQNQNDETLVMLTLAGEQNAYAALVERYEKAVIAAATSVTHNRSMAEDSAQDAFITAWIKLNMLREPDKYGAWVCRIAKNCAKNTVMRFQSFISLDDGEKPVADIADIKQPDPSDTYELSEEKELLHESVSKLPEKVRQIIDLHYFKDLSVSEIALKMGISEGTVKWQLHEGRKRIRKELCAMSEEYNDTLVQRVMKKVEELKLWQFKNSKNGFEKVYKEVLKEVEELPESMDKYHALADVLLRGWWWISGEKNDALFDRIRDAAEKGKNDEVMVFITAKEDSKLYGDAKIKFIKETQIPRLEKLGFVKALAAEWSWLAYTYFEEGQPEKGFEAYEKGLEVVKPSDSYYSFMKNCLKAEKMNAEEFKDKNFNKYMLLAAVEEYHFIDGKPKRWNRKRRSKGGLYSYDDINEMLLLYASRCDKMFTAEGLKEGEKHIGSDGTVLEFTSDNVSVTTPYGSFEGCVLWTTTHEHTVFKAYYKEGVGIVKAEKTSNGFTVTRFLKEYEIKGGEGVIPFFKGNRWVYTSDHAPEIMNIRSEYTVEYCDNKTAIISCFGSVERIKYDENSWEDMISQIRTEYWVKSGDNEDTIADVSYPVERARVLAKTPMEKAHTKAACSVAERIMKTDTRFNPEYTEIGHWNFFQRLAPYKKEDKTISEYDFRWDFEWKNMSGGFADPKYPLLFNHIYSILQDAVGCLWCEKWKDGYKDTININSWGDTYANTKILCENAGTVKTKAGIFENCLKLSLDIGKYGQYVEYRSGKKEYYFAPNIGIVKIVHHYCDDILTSVYELTEYEGTGEGYMPFTDGLVRKYEALGLTDGYIAGAEYTYASDDEGQVYIFEDNLGVRTKPQECTVYPSTCGEELEEKLWEEGRRDMGDLKHDLLDESRLRHDINNFNLFLHYLDQNDRSWYVPERKTAQSKHRMRMFEILGEDGGDVPKGWLGAYARECFLLACSLFGSGNKEEGYLYLDRSLELFKKWDDIPKGELLETGDKFIFGGIKVIKGNANVIVLPNGTKEVIRESGWFFSIEYAWVHGWMTAAHGWEWFDSVREEERFKKAIETAKAIIK